MRLAPLIVLASLATACSGTSDVTTTEPDDVHDVAAMEDAADAEDTDTEDTTDAAVTQDADAVDGDVLDTGTPDTAPDTSTSDTAVPDTTTDTSLPPDPDVCQAWTEALRATDGPVTTVAPAGPGRVRVGDTETTLRAVVSNASTGDIIELADGTYTFDDAPDGSYTGLYLTTPGVTIRSASGDPSSVVLDSAYVSHGGGSGVITVAAADVVIADLTVTRSIYHLVHVWNGGDNLWLHNVRLIDGGQQFVKTSPGSGNRISEGRVTCSRFEMTDAGRANVWGYGAADGSTRCYTGGIDTHDTDGWIISDNRFEGIYCDDTPHPAHGRDRDGVAQATYTGGLAEAAIHMWDGQEGSPHLIERNVVVDCARGIQLGLGDTHRVTGGTIRNNMVANRFPGGGEHDVGISLEGASDVDVLHNTVVFTDPAGYANAIEYRFPATTSARILNNLTNRQIRLRNGATGDVHDNRDDADAAWFVDAAAGDLHLSTCSADLSGTAAGVAEDIDGDPHPVPPTIGADACE